MKHYSVMTLFPFSSSVVRFGFLFGALGRGVAGAVTIGAMAEFANQPHRRDPTQRRVPCRIRQHYDNCHWSIAS